MGSNSSDLKSEKLADQVNSENFVLEKEHRDYLRKSFLKTLKTVLIVHSEVYKVTQANQVNLKIENEIKMSKSEEVNSHIFDGRDYELWKVRILLYLRFKKCDIAATREKTDNDNAAEWEEKDVKAMQCIYASISNDQLEFVRDENTAYNIMKKFDKQYLKKSSGSIVNIRNKLGRMKLKDYEDSSKFFIEFEKNINDLRSAGVRLDESEKLNYMLGTLPDSTDHIADLIDTLPEADRTCDFIKRKIQRQEERSKSIECRKKSSVFKVEKNKELICFECGGRGHFKRDCPSQNKRGGIRNRGNRRGGAQYQQNQQQ